MKQFSDYAHEKLVGLYNNHAHEVGSVLLKSDPAKYKSYTATDCITYVLNVLGYAFEKAGDAKTAKYVWRLGEHGTELAAYLVKRHGWRGIYINPDVSHPLDGDSEHSFSYRLALKHCHYYRIPLSYRVVNYSVTPMRHVAFGRLNPKAGPTALNTIDLVNLALVKFGFGVSRGGRHTWLFSWGRVYEVHWEGIGDTLYEASPLRTYSWLSGVIVVPPDQALMLAASTRLACGGR